MRQELRHRNFLIRLAKGSSVLLPIVLLVLSQLLGKSNPNVNFINSTSANNSSSPTLLAGPPRESLEVININGAESTSPAPLKVVPIRAPSP